MPRLSFGNNFPVNLQLCFIDVPRTDPWNLSQSDMVQAVALAAFENIDVLTRSIHNMCQAAKTGNASLLMHIIAS